MTGKSDFTEEEWKLVLEAPPSAGLLVIAADRGGSIRETFSMAKAYTEVRKEHGESELLVSAKPEMDHTRYKSPEGLNQAQTTRVRAASPTAGSSGGFASNGGPGNTYGHADPQQPGDNNFHQEDRPDRDGQPSISMRSSKVLATFANGLWTSDHAGGLSVLYRRQQEVARNQTEVPRGRGPAPRPFFVV